MEGSEYETTVIRIVNLSESTTADNLKQFIHQIIRPAGNIDSLFIRKDERLQIIYAYLVFEIGYDAVKTAQTLNGHIYGNVLDVTLVSPSLNFKRYRAVEMLEHKSSPSYLNSMHPLLRIAFVRKREGCKNVLKNKEEATRRVQQETGFKNIKNDHMQKPLQVPRVLSLGTVEKSRIQNSKSENSNFNEHKKIISDISKISMSTQSNYRHHQEYSTSVTPPENKFKEEKYNLEYTSSQECKTGKPTLWERFERKRDLTSTVNKVTTNSHRISAIPTLAEKPTLVPKAIDTHSNIFRQAGSPKSVALSSTLNKVATNSPRSAKPTFSEKPTLMPKVIDTHSNIFRQTGGPKSVVLSSTLNKVATNSPRISAKPTLAEKPILVPKAIDMHSNIFRQTGSPKSVALSSTLNKVATNSPRISAKPALAEKPTLVPKALDTHSNIFTQTGIPKSEGSSSTLNAITTYSYKVPVRPTLAATSGSSALKVYQLPNKIIKPAETSRNVFDQDHIQTPVRPNSSLKQFMTHNGVKVEEKECVVS